MSDNPRRIVDVISSSLHKLNQGYFRSSIIFPQTLFLLHCAFESQSTNVCSDVVEHLELSIDIVTKNCTPSDMYTLGFVMCRNHHPIKELNLTRCYFGIDGMQAWINEFHRTLSEHQTISLERLVLSENKIGIEEVKCLSEGFQYFRPLQELNLSTNNIGTDGAELLFDGLKFCHKLKKLVLHYNKLGNDGIKCLSEGLKHTPELRTLELCYNNVGHVGAKYLSESLTSCPQLQRLDLSGNSIGPIGTRCLSEVLPYCTNLLRLHLSHNNIGDDGAKFLSAKLTFCPKLSGLYIQENSISREGRRALESMENKINSKRKRHQNQLFISL